MSGAVGVNRPDAAPWPRLGPALSLSWISRLPLSPNIPLGAPGNIPWFAADCPAPRSLRCGQSGRRPGGRRLGRQRPGTLRCIVAQEVVGGTDQQRKAAASHLWAALHGSMGCNAACLDLCLPSLLGLCPWMQASAEVTGASSQLLSNAWLYPAPGAFANCPPPAPLGFCFVAVHFFLIARAPILTLLRALWI